MELFATADTKDYEICPPGVYLATCIWVIDLGMQTSAYYGKTSRKVKISFELHNTKMEDGRPFMISKTYTLSLHEKSNLCIDLVSWRGRKFTEEERNGFGISKLLGVPCQINVIHNTSQDGQITYANIGAIMPVQKGTQVPMPINQKIFYNTQEPDMKIWDIIPEGIRNKINQSKIDGPPEQHQTQQPVSQGEQFNHYQPPQQYVQSPQSPQSPQYQHQNLNQQPQAVQSQQPIIDFAAPDFDDDIPF